MVGYIRTAQKKDKDEINEKMSILKEVFDKHKSEWDIVDVIVDNGYSGRNDNRPGLKKIVSGKVDCSLIVTLGQQMIARDVLLYKKIYQSLLNNDKKILFFLV